MVISQAINCVLYTTKGLNEALSSKISVCSWLFFSGNDKMRSKALRIICGLFLLVTITLPLVKKKCQSCRLSEVIQLNNCLDNKPRLLWCLLNNDLIFVFFKDSPAQIKINGSNSASIYLTSSPPKLSPPGRQDDLSAILRVINSATKFVYVSVMDYFPTTLYTEQRTWVNRVASKL